MTAPAISVIMATYNGAAFIDETIDSLRNQSFADFELVVVDDCSTDDTVARLHTYHDPRIRIFRTPDNAGPVGARNLAVAMAQGRYLAALDQDDISHPERLARQFAYLEAHPETVLLATAARRLTAGRTMPDGFPTRTTPGLIRWMMHVRNPFVWSSVMMRTDTIRALGIFSRVERQFAEDFDLYHRLAAHGEIARLDEVLTTYRCHPHGASRTKQTTMTANAADVLADSYATLNWQAGQAIALPITRHVAGREPVTSQAGLLSLRKHLAAITAQVFASHNIDAPSRQLIEIERGRVLRMLALRYGKYRARRWMQSFMRNRVGNIAVVSDLVRQARK